MEKNARFVVHADSSFALRVRRSLHVTLTLSEATRGVVSNRPLSPHLPVKKPQLRATFSISHRIFGASLTLAILLIPIDLLQMFDFFYQTEKVVHLFLDHDHILNLGFCLVLGLYLVLGLDLY
ncbi:uncharacterized protein LOC141848282 [Curcuma longa]|uniref:uncharacterized protein LOC141848282 n=1 Tax=Curcuma longa TaxID=136217 RepID=UPI003D9E3956